MGHEPSPKYPWHHGEIKKRMPKIYLGHFQHKQDQNKAKRPPSWTFEHAGPFLTSLGSMPATQMNATGLRARCYKQSKLETSKRLKTLTAFISHVMWLPIEGARAHGNEDPYQPMISLEGGQRGFTINNAWPLIDGGKRDHS